MSERLFMAPESRSGAPGDRRRMRALVISHLYPRPSAPDTGIFVARQVEELRKLGVEVDVVSPRAFDPRKLRDEPRKWKEPNGSEVRGLHYPKLPGQVDFGLHGPGCAAAILPTLLSMHRSRRYHLVHGQMLIPDGFAAVTFGGMTKLPVVVTERGYLRTLIERSAGDRRALRLVLQKASEAVFVSASLQETAHQLAQPKRSSVVYTGLDSDRFTPSD